MKVKFKKQEIDWIERTADIETARIFNQFNNLLVSYKGATNDQKKLFDNQIEELIKTYDFLKTLRAKLEIWDCRFDIDTEIIDKDEVKE
jgi:hypothetical protein